MLFTNTGTDAHIHLSFCQWAKDNNMVLVYGYLKSKHDIRESFGDYSKPCYLTVTAVPALNGCQECIQVAAVSSVRNQFLLILLNLFPFCVVVMINFMPLNFTELRRRRNGRCLEFVC